jgi:hypothetical protein
MPNGLVLYFNLDEAAGTAAIDTSGRKHNGLYVGAVGTPAPSDNVPVLRFPNPRSRAFAMASRHAVQVAPMPAALKRPNDITVSIFYRATAVDAGDATLFSAGNSYGVKVGRSSLEVWKRVSGARVVSCSKPVAGLLDGKWHHVAGVLSASGMRLYFDGSERCSNADGLPVVYDQGPDAWVGRHGNGALDEDFDGHIDEVRVFDIALSPGDVGDLGRGSHAP